MGIYDAKHDIPFPFILHELLSTRSSRAYWSLAAEPTRHVPSMFAVDDNRGDHMWAFVIDGPSSENIHPPTDSEHWSFWYFNEVGLWPRGTGTRPFYQSPVPEDGGPED